MTHEEPVVFVVDDDREAREATGNVIASMGLRVQTYETATSSSWRRSSMRSSAIKTGR